MSHPDIPEQTSQYSTPPEPQAGGMTAEEAIGWLKRCKGRCPGGEPGDDESQALDLAIAALRSHDQLVGACELTLDRLDYLRNLWGDEGVTRATVDKIRAALAAARPAAGRES